jgi:hypothetical protein
MGECSLSVYRAEIIIVWQGCATGEKAASRAQIFHPILLHLFSRPCDQKTFFHIVNHADELVHRYAEGRRFFGDAGPG